MTGSSQFIVRCMTSSAPKWRSRCGDRPTTGMGSEQPMREVAGRLSLYAVGCASIFVLWHLAAVCLVRSILFPPPWPVLLKAVELARDGTLGENIGISLQRILLGFC